MNMEGNYYLFKYNHLIKKHFLEGSFTEGIQIIPELMELIDSDQYNWDNHRIMVFITELPVYILEQVKIKMP